MARSCTVTGTGDDPWTATSLLSAFVELVIAFLFLAGATITFFTSKFVKVFGLHLPCFDRVGRCIERQSNVRRYAFLNLVSEELRGLSHYFLHRTFIKDRSACEQSLASTSGSEEDCMTSLEPMSANQLPFHRRRHRPQMPCHCFCHHHADELRTGIYDEATALISQMERNNAGLLLNCHSYSCSSSCRRRLHKQSGKGKFLDVLPDADRVSMGNEAEGIHLEREHSLKVFPEECIEYNALIQGHGRDEVMGLPRDLGKLGSALDLPPRAEGFSEGCASAQICGGASTTELTNDSVEKECAFAIIDSSGSPGTQGRIEQKPENARERNGDSLSDHDERGKGSTQTAGRVITGDGQPTGLACESDDDTLKLKEKLAAEREVLNRTYLELEKERIASASAADEAIAYITKLQEDKAALQMEAVQSQRIAEERAMFDEDAIVALRDVLLKREAEKLALEKEIELYRRKLLMGVLEAGEKRIKADKLSDSSASEGDNEYSMLEFSKRKKYMHREQSVSAGGAILAEVFCPRGESNVELTKNTLSLMSGDTNLLEPFEFMIDDGSSSEEGMIGQDGDVTNHNLGDCPPETVKDAYYEDQIDDLDIFQQMQSSGQTLASLRDQSEGMKRKFEGSAAEIQWQHVLSRVWNLEEQITSLRTKDNTTLEQPLEALSSQFNAKDLVQVRLSKERRETSGCKSFKHEHSAEKVSASRRQSGVRDPGKRIMRAKSEADIFPSISRTSCRTCDNRHAKRTVSCELDPTTNCAILDSLRGNGICSEMRDQLSMPDPFVRPGVTLEEAQVQEKKLLETGSPSFFSSLEEETVLADEKGEAIDNNASEFSKYSSHEGVFSESYTSSIIRRDTYKCNVQEEIKKIMYRLQMAEDDRGLLRQAIDSMRKEMGGMDQLLDTAQQLRLLLTSEGMVGAPETSQQLDGVSIVSAVEAGKSPPQKRHCVGEA